MLDELITSQKNFDYSGPILLFKEDDHEIYWLGYADNDAFRTNVFLIIDGEEAVIVDPGDKSKFPELISRIKKTGHYDKVKSGIFCHQDPDVCGCIDDCLKEFPRFDIITSQRTNLLLPHYGISNYNYYDSGEINDNKLTFTSGNELIFIDAYFLHFPGAIATYDKKSGFLFSGDIWASIDYDFKFIVTNFKKHISKLNLFHLDYMSSSVATKGFASKLNDFNITSILPQHGSLISRKYVKKAVKYLEELHCGLDLLYPEIS
jgi:flavorubredoxin